MLIESTCHCYEDSTEDEVGDLTNSEGLGYCRMQQVLDEFNQNAAVRAHCKGADQCREIGEVELDEARNTAIESVKAAENATKQAASTTQIAEEKGKINDMLSAKLADAEDKLAGYNKLKESEETLKKQINDLQHNNNMLQVELNHAKEKNSEIKCKLNEANESINEFKDIITDLKSQIVGLNRDIEEQKRTSSQAQEIAVERAIAQTEKSMMEQISSLRDEKVRLETKIEMMK